DEVAPSAAGAELERLDSPAISPRAARALDAHGYGQLAVRAAQPFGPAGPEVYLHSITYQVIAVPAGGGGRHRLPDGRLWLAQYGGGPLRIEGLLLHCDGGGRVLRFFQPAD